MKKIWIFMLVLLGGWTSNCGFGNNSPPSGVAHKYEVIEVEDTSVARRARIRVRILAPSAVTSEDRIATAMAAALDTSRAVDVDFVSVMLEATPSLYGFMLAAADYAPDGCGVSGSGDNCTGLVWSSLTATDMQVSKEQVEIWEAWERHKENFTERVETVEASYSQVNEERLLVFLAEKFNTTPAYVSDQMLAKVSLAASHKVIELP